MGFYARYANLISSFFHFLICPGFKIEDVVHTPPPLSRHGPELSHNLT